VKSSIRVVIFDCDGVMFNSRAANVGYYNKILARFNKPLLTAEDTDVVHMYTGEDSVNYLFQGDPRREEAQAYRKRISYDEFIPLMEMEPHLTEVLGAVQERFKVGLATNRTSTIYTILDLFDLKQYFDYVVSALDVTRPKPDPETVEKILRHFQVRGEQTLYIGDMEVDEIVARTAHVPFVAYKNPRLNAQYHINDLRAVLELVDSLLS
jgi:HAD superfamily hydrolase (TIGR01549 family)